MSRAVGAPIHAHVRFGNATPREAVAERSPARAQNFGGTCFVFSDMLNREEEDLAFMDAGAPLRSHSAQQLSLETSFVKESATIFSASDIVG